MLTIQTHLKYQVLEPCPLLLQIHAARTDGQSILEEKFEVASGIQTGTVSGEDGVGSRFWFDGQDVFECSYTCRVAVSRSHQKLTGLTQTPYPDLPDDVVKYLMPSRYCHPEDFESFIAKNFADVAGGDLVTAIADWIGKNLRYTPGTSDSNTTATDSFGDRAGVCRDYAHLQIAMARAAAIPARMVSAYAPDVQPQDFHALVEVYLEGAWHLVDPTQMASTNDTVVIGVGRDAADISFLTSYGTIALIQQSISVERD